jgi:hypothetical protein
VIFKVHAASIADPAEPANYGARVGPPEPARRGLSPGARL